MKGITETMTLGKIIDWLERLPPEDEVVFDFCRASPSGIDSSRGDYAELALGYSFEQVATVLDVLKWCKGAVGATFSGYKGGDYMMTRDTQVWVDKWGAWTGTAIDSMEHNYGQAMIRTKPIR